MTWLKSLALAFAMYSKLPVPRVSWEGKHTQYVLCAFPLVGWAVGALELLWWYIAALTSPAPLFSASVALLLPILVTGGIHLDGFCDVSDALASHQSREKMLEIMKDSHVGAFVPISLGAYLVLSLGVWTQAFTDPLPLRSMLALCLLFPLSRACSGLMCVTLPNARGGGLLFHFSSGACPAGVKALLWVQLLLYPAAMLWLDPRLAPWIILCAALALLLFRWGILEKKFDGGITGDLAGWFLQVFELAALLGAALAKGVLL